MELILRSVLILIVILDYALCQEIEYYPSQSEINFNKFLNSKVFTPVRSKRQTDIKDQQNEGKMRIFNQSNVVQKEKRAADPIFNQSNVVQKKRAASPIFNQSNVVQKGPIKRAADPIFRGHPKTREEQWNEKFLSKSTAFDQTPSLIRLIHAITTKHLNDCTPVILYDNAVLSNEGLLFQNLLMNFPVTFVHGNIEDTKTLKNPDILRPVRECVHFIVFLTDLETCSKVIGMQSISKVVIIAKTSQWAVQEFLAGPLSRKFVNLLVIGQSFKDDDDTLEAPYILYTHKLYIDGLGASQPVVLTSWTRNKYSREVNLFPPKMKEGYAGHRFIVAAANQPPFVIRRIKSDRDGGNPRVVWDGVEIRVLHMLAERNNFSIEVIEPQELSLGPGDAVAKEVALGRADIAIAGMYLTSERTLNMDMTFSHSEDCAVFVTLLSTALPRYRAILGPFHWHVWVALTATYLFGIFPLAFSDKHTLRHLLQNSGEVENMFWYVFGTFTNCFTFVGKNSWSKSNKLTTRLLIGWYWIFTIIITSCYTGSIIAFVTLPIFPETVDTIDQLIKGFFRLGTLDRGGWERWFFNSSDPKTNKLLKKMEFVPSVESGIRNITKAFFWPYAFLGSQAELEYIVQANFTATKSKRAQLHVSEECFVPFGVSIGFPNQSLYTAKLSSDIQRMLQAGLLNKIASEVRWEIQRSPAGKLLAAGSGTLKIPSAEEKGLTIEDTQGMFLLLAAGFILGTAALISEWMGGCTRRCPLRRRKPTALSSASSRGNLIPTPRSDVESEIHIIPDSADMNNRHKVDMRVVSADSRDTLEGELIHVTDDSIIVHEGFDVAHWDTRRSSSIDVDKEVREIFERDHKRRRFQSLGVIDTGERNRGKTASHGAFGDRVSLG